MVAFFLLTAFLCVIIFEPLPLTTDFFFLAFSLTGTNCQHCLIRNQCTLVKLVS